MLNLGQWLSYYCRGTNSQVSKATGLIFSVSGLPWDTSMQPHPVQGRVKKEELLVSTSNGPYPSELVEHGFTNVNFRASEFLYHHTMNLTTFLCGLTQCPFLWALPNTGFKLTERLETHACTSLLELERTPSTPSLGVLCGPVCIYELGKCASLSVSHRERTAHCWAQGGISLVLL